MPDLWQIEKLQNEVRDLRGLYVGVERTLRKSHERVGGNASFDPAEKFIGMARAAVEGKPYVAKAAVNPAMTTVPEWAGELVGSAVGGYILSLAGQSAFASIAAQALGVSFNRSGSARVIAGGSVAASFVGQGKPIPASGGLLDAITIVPSWVAAIVVLTLELQKSANFTAVLRKLLADGISAALDDQFLGNSAASDVSPQGVLYGLTAVPASSAVQASEAMRADLEALVAALDAPQSPCFVMSPSRRVFAAATLPGSFDYPIIASSALPEGRVVCVDSGGLAVAFGQTPRFDVSAEATIEENDAPSDAGVMTGTPVRSFWQTGTLGLQVMLSVSWGARPGAASFIDNVSW
ncbi:phage major capsid protein [Sinorhizobium medicae]|nr:phage major capsid protein [Sinorhizobium medicae]MDX0652732.1 phage major capsid protein [Sinorhizobium medicae]MDX1156594.1 phage major capsid protein [Sinorhizobium medicae]